MRFVIFDDSKRDNFFPLTFTRSTGDLRVGILKLRQRITAYFEMSETNIIISDDLEELYKERHQDWTINEIKKDDSIFINSRLKINDKLVELIKSLKNNTCMVYGENIIAARCKPESMKISSEGISDIFVDLTKIEYEDVLWKFTWEFIAENAEFIRRDFNDFFYEKDNFFDAEQGVTILNPYNIWLGEGSLVAPGVVIDAREGPVIIDENASIMSNSVIVGPVYIGKKSIIKIGSKIYEGTSIGPFCKIGGEVEKSIFLGYTNKQHDGFLGHSYLGEWINLGADTNNSDLKNNYKNVKSYFYPERKPIDTKSQFVGCVIGDHSKTGINSSINTGAVIGIGCNLYGKGLIRDFVPSFSWGEADDCKPHKFDKFQETANLVKKRRGLKILESEKELYSKIRNFVFEQK